MMRGHFKREAIWMMLWPAILVIVALLGAILLPRIVSGRAGGIDSSDNPTFVESNNPTLPAEGARSKIN